MRQEPRPIKKIDEARASEDPELARALNRWSTKPTIKEKQEQDDRAEAFRGQLERVINGKNIISVVRNPETGAEMKVIDEQGLHDAIDVIFEKSRLWNEKRPKAEVIAALPSIIGDQPVLTSNQMTRGEWKPKQFFYLPASAAAATDISAIKSYPPFHRFVTDFVFDAEKFPYPLRKQEGKTVSALEAKTAALLFHPDYGDAFRNEKNRLIIRNPDTREYTQFTGKFFHRHGITYKRFAHTENARAKDSPAQMFNIREGIAANLPNLVEKGLVRPVEDFKQMTYGRVHVSDQRVERAGVTPSGDRHIRGVKHYIGKQFIGKSVRIVDISPTLGAVVDMSAGSERVTHTFNIIPREQAKAGAANMYLAGAPLTQTRPFSAEAVALPRRSDESLEQYRDRIEKTDRGLAHLLLHVVPKYPALSKMLRDKPTYELASIAQAAYLLGRDKQAKRFGEFVQAYGELGARTFLVTGNNDELREKVFEFSRSSSQEHVQKVFRAYGHLIDSIDRFILTSNPVQNECLKFGGQVSWANTAAGFCRESES